MSPLTKNEPPRTPRRSWCPWSLGGSGCFAIAILRRECLSVVKWAVIGAAEIPEQSSKLMQWFPEAENAPQPVFHHKRRHDPTILENYELFSEQRRFL
jgi:hypothetical protein